MGVKVTVPFDPEWRALAWAKEHCTSYITNTSVAGRIRPVPGGWVNDVDIVYYFDDEHDATMFTLKWG